MAGKHTKCSLSLPCCSYTSVFLSVRKADDDICGIISVGLTLTLTLLVAISAQIAGLLALFFDFGEHSYTFDSLWVILAAAFSFKVLCDIFETIDIISWMVVARKLEDPEEDLEGGEKTVVLSWAGKLAGIVLFMIPKMTIECFLGMFGAHCILRASDQVSAVVVCFYVILLSELDQLIYNSMAPQGVLKKVKPVAIESRCGRMVYVLIPPICKLVLSLILYFIFQHHFTTVGMVKGIYGYY